VTIIRLRGTNLVHVDVIRTQLLLM